MKINFEVDGVRGTFDDETFTWSFPDKKVQAAIEAVARSSAYVSPADPDPALAIVQKTLRYVPNSKVLPSERPEFEYDPDLVY